MRNQDINVSMQCPVCGSEKFEFNHQSDDIKCYTCNKEFSKNELMELNSEKIKANISEFIDDVKEEAIHELKKLFSTNWK